MSATNRTRTGTEHHRPHVSAHGAETGRILLSLLAYVVVFAVLNHAWILDAAQSVILPNKISGSDARLHVWILWWVYHSLTGDPSALLDAPINYPAPGQLTGSEHFLSSQILFAPVFALTGNPVLALNFVLLVSYPLAALAMERLLVALGFRRLPAWGGGLLFALGPLAAPPNTHMLHHLHLFFPLIALTLLRLRERVSASRAAIFAACLLIGLLSAYYMAAMLLLCAFVWGVAEALRPGGERMRFIVAVASIVAVCLIAVALPSIVYLGRSEVWAYPEQRQIGLDRMQNLVTWVVLHGAQQTFGFWASILAVIGIAGVANRELRRPVWIGLTFLAIGVFLAAGGARLLETLNLPGPLGSLAAMPARFLRMTLRFTVLAGFGIALLASVALRLATLRFRPAVATALISAVLVMLIWERGRVIAEAIVDPVYAATRDVAIYRAVGEITRENGPGPLLELPTRNRGWNTEAEGMVGAIWHGMPLITGHTGYLPPHRAAVNEAIRALPSPDAVQELIDATRLRWILIRPAGQETDRGARKRLVRSLSELPVTAKVWPIDGWFLLELRSEGAASGASRSPAAPAPSATAKSS